MEQGKGNKEDQIAADIELPSGEEGIMSKKSIRFYENM